MAQGWASGTVSGVRGPSWHLSRALVCHVRHGVSRGSVWAAGLWGSQTVLVTSPQGGDQSSWPCTDRGSPAARHCRSCLTPRRSSVYQQQGFFKRGGSWYSPRDGRSCPSSHQRSPQGLTAFGQDAGSRARTARRESGGAYRGMAGRWEPFSSTKRPPARSTQQWWRDSRACRAVVGLSLPS